MTANSKLILEIINSSSEHLTAEQIYLKLKDTPSRMVMATVYNNLNALFQQGSIQKVSLEGQPDRYDKVYRHDHLICRKCGKITDLSLEDLTRKIEAETRISIESYDLKVFYICEECKKRK